MGDEPPFTGIAENVTDVPGQNGFAEAVIETLTGMLGLTVTARQELVPVLQEFCPWTQTFPDVAELPKFTVI